MTQPGRPVPDDDEDLIAPEPGREPGAPTEPVGPARTPEPDHDEPGGIPEGTPVDPEGGGSGGTGA
jgi:hypothetical protein